MLWGARNPEISVQTNGSEPISRACTGFCPGSEDTCASSGQKQLLEKSCEIELGTVVYLYLKSLSHYKVHFSKSEDKTPGRQASIFTFILVSADVRGGLLQKVYIHSFIHSYSNLFGVYLFIGILYFM